MIDPALFRTRGFTVATAGALREDRAAAGERGSAALGALCFVAAPLRWLLAAAQEPHAGAGALRAGWVFAAVAAALALLAAVMFRRGAPRDLG
ncbi:hypothetical protein ABZ769_24370 [Streptomyces olivoreticuli]